ncbi:MAG: hypothetical protein JJE09_02695, partial [Bacteroidia bacterium]|nr:hypothetical protein [Bacteroidia bacterium]
MKFTYQLIATLVACFVLQYFLPWWTMAIGAAVLGYVFGNKGFVSFLIGFLGVGLLWLGMAMFIDVSTQSILTEKINKILPLNVFILTTLVG